MSAHGKTKCPICHRLAGWTIPLMTRTALGGKNFNRLDAIRRLYAVYGADPCVLVRIVTVLLLPRAVAVALSGMFVGFGRCLRLLRPRVKAFDSAREKL
jgi:hypothetical protein